MMELFTIGFAVCMLMGIGCFGLFETCIDWFENIFSSKEERFMYTVLFIVSLIMFGYLMYVLVKPEKF